MDRDAVWIDTTFVLHCVFTVVSGWRCERNILVEKIPADSASIFISFNYLIITRHIIRIYLFEKDGWIFSGDDQG